MKIRRIPTLAALAVALAAPSCVPEFEFAGDAEPDAGAGGSGQPDAGGCASDDDCTISMRSHCNEFRECVRCLPSADDCEARQYCADDYTCRGDCKNDVECQTDFGPLLTCQPDPADPLKRKCLGCGVDGDCSAGNICDTTSTECVSGCRDSTNCDDGWECCGAQADVPGTCQLTLVETENCGACGNVCPVPMHATAACRSGTCGFDCEMYFQDCDEMPGNGCEIDVRIDPAHCGACGEACPSGQMCVDRQCVP